MGNVRALLLPAVVALAACGQPHVPTRLAGLPRNKVVVGTRAVKLLEAMHRGRFHPPQAVVAEYGNGRLQLYIAMFSGESQAREAFDTMVKALATSGAFTPPRPHRDEPQRFFVVGPGGHHLFWRVASKIYWLAGDPEVLFTAAEELEPPPPGIWL